MLMKILLVAVSATVCLAIIPPPNIYRPCPLNDIACIRRFVGANSNLKCNKAVRGAAPAVFVLAEARFETPAFNASYVDTNLIISGLNRCYISEFYINRKSGGGALGLNCPGLIFESDRLMYQHQSLLEDSTFRYHIKGTYPLIRLTTSLPNGYNLDICQTFTFADIAVLPIFKIDPIDVATRNFLATDLSYLDIFERETFLYRAKLLFRTFFNSVICDYGC